MRLFDNRFVFVTSHGGDKIRISKVFVIAPNCLNSDELGAKRVKYYKILTSTIDERTRLIIKSNATFNSSMNVIISNTFALPQNDSPNVQKQVGTNLSIRLDKSFFGDDQTLHIRIESQTSEN